MFSTVALLATVGVAAADPVVLRMSCVAPEGSAWANLLRDYAREIDTVTQGAVHIKWYFGAVTGDEKETLQAIRKGRLDGIASGGMVCEELAPSMHIQGLTGVFQSRDEAGYVMERLRETIEEETRQNGFEMLITSGLGPEVIFSREPVRSMADLRRMKFWRWAGDDIGIAVAKEMNVPVVPLALDEAARAYDEKRVDGFIAIPTAALAFQWSAQARYITDLRTGYLTGCIAVSHRAFDKLTLDQQKYVRSLAAKYSFLFGESGRRQDDALLEGLFQKQGLRPIPPSETFRSEFFEVARQAREQTAAKMIPRPLLNRALQLLADYRAEHRSTAGTR